MEILELKNIYENYKVIIRDINRRLSKDRKGKLATKENISILISEYILEDCKEVIKLISENNKRRYVYNIIRTMCESIIEYKYSKYLDQKYIKLLINKLNLLEHEIKLKIVYKQVPELDYENKETKGKSR